MTGSSTPAIKNIGKELFCGFQSSLMKADFNKENTELTLTLTTPDYMSKETAEKLKPFLRRPVVYHWKNGAFSI